MKYIVLVGPVDHDGVRYEEGEEISLQGDEAAALVAVGAVRVAKVASKDSKVPEADKPTAG